MKYSFSGRIRFSESDENGVLSLNSLVNYLQDCSTFHAEDHQMGLAWSREHHQAWVLAAWQILIDEYPVLGDEVTVSTWAYGFRNCIGYRNYSMEKPDGTLIVRANSDWVLMDMEKGIPVKVSEEQTNAYGVHPEWKLTDDFGPRKIKIPSEGTVLEPFGIQEYHLDTNHHVNNGQYIQMAYGYLPSGFRTRKLRAEYKMQAHLGDCIYPRISGEKNAFVITLNDEKGEPYFIGEFKQ